MSVSFLWLFSLRVIFSYFSVAANFILFFLVTEWCAIVYMYHSFSIHSFGLGYLEFRTFDYWGKRCNEHRDAHVFSPLCFLARGFFFNNVGIMSSKLFYMQVPLCLLLSSFPPSLRANCLNHLRSAHVLSFSPLSLFLWFLPFLVIS